MIIHHHPPNVSDFWLLFKALWPFQVFWNQTILHGSYLSMHEVQTYGWVDASNTSLLNQARFVELHRFTMKNSGLDWSIRRKISGY